MPQFANNSTVGFSTSIPYFWAISDDKDMTITPKLYAGENILIKNEYRQAFKNSFLIVDSSYTEGYKDSTDKKTSGSRNHMFAKFTHNFSEKEDSYNTSLWVGNCQRSSPSFIRTALISPKELLKYSNSLTITMESFF